MPGASEVPISVRLKPVLPILLGGIITSERGRASSASPIRRRLLVSPDSDTRAWLCSRYVRRANFSEAANVVVQLWCLRLS